jgi:hypothetical protein
MTFRLMLSSIYHGGVQVPPRGGSRLEGSGDSQSAAVANESKTEN